MGAEAARMHDTFGNAFMVEVEDFLAEVWVFQQERSARTLLETGLIVGNRRTLLRSEGGDAISGNLVRFAARPLILCIAFADFHSGRDFRRCLWAHRGKLLVSRGLLGRA